MNLSNVVNKMTNDLFLKKEPARIRLYNWLRKRNHALSHEIIEWGTRNHCNWAMRRLNELKKEGKIREMPKNKRISYYGNTREQAWEVIRWPESCL